MDDLPEASPITPPITVTPIADEYDRTPLAKVYREFQECYEWAILAFLCDPIVNRKMILYCEEQAAYYAAMTEKLR